MHVAVTYPLISFSKIKNLAHSVAEHPREAGTNGIWNAIQYRTVQKKISVLTPIGIIVFRFSGREGLLCKRSLELSHSGSFTLLRCIPVGDFPGCSKAVCPGRYGNFKPCTFSGLTGLCDGNSGNSKNFPYEEQAISMD